MATITNQQRRKVLTFADRLAQIAAEEAPDAITKRELWAVVNSIRKRFGWGIEEKQIEVWRAIHHGASSISDLIMVTKFHKDDIYEITRMFETRKLVEFRKMSLTGNGRPGIFIFPIAELESFSPQKSN